MVKMRGQTAPIRCCSKVADLNNIVANMSSPIKSESLEIRSWIKSLKQRFTLALT